MRSALKRMSASARSTLVTPSHIGGRRVFLAAPDGVGGPAIDPALQPRQDAARKPDGSSTGVYGLRVQGRSSAAEETAEFCSFRSHKPPP